MGVSRSRGRRDRHQREVIVQRRDPKPWVLFAVFLLPGSVVFSVIDVLVTGPLVGGWWTWRVGISLFTGAAVTAAVLLLLPISDEVRWRFARTMIVLLPLWSVAIALNRSGSRYRSVPPSAVSQQVTAAAMIGIAVTLFAVVLWWAATGQHDTRT